MVWTCLVCCAKMLAKVFVQVLEAFKTITPTYEQVLWKMLWFVTNVTNSREGVSNISDKSQHLPQHLNEGTKSSKTLCMCLCVCGPPLCEFLQALVTFRIFRNFVDHFHLQREMNKNGVNISRFLCKDACLGLCASTSGLWDNCSNLWTSVVEDVFICH